MPICRIGKPIFAKAAAILAILNVALVSSFGQDVQTLSFDVEAEATTVFDWSLDRCEDNDIPDTPIRAVRVSSGQVLAFASSDKTRRFLGSTLESIRRDCTVVYASLESADPADYADRTFIAALWRSDDKTIVALTHNEYQANTHPGRCKFQGSVPCWYNTVGLFKSTNEGAEFQPVTKKPVAAPAFQQQVDQGEPRGFFNPTNIVKYGDYYYTLIRAGGGSQPFGMCLFRAADTGDIASWSYFDGQTFVPSARDPYRDDVSNARPCATLKNLAGAVTSLVVHENSGLFIAVSERPDPKQPADSVLYSTSRDLLSWAAPKPLMHLPIGNSRRCSDTYRFQYPTLLDPKSKSMNFETISDNSFLYMTRVRIGDCRMTLTRDLIRIPIRIH